MDFLRPLRRHHQPGKFFWTAACILSAIPGWLINPASGSVLTLPEVLQTIAVHYPVMASAHQEIEKAQADLLAKQGGFDPVFKSAFKDTMVGYYRNSYFDAILEQPTPLWGTRVFGGYRSGQGNFPLYDGRSSTFTRGEIRAGFNIPLLKNGQIDERRATIKTAEKGFEASHASFQAQQVDSEKQASYRYWDWVAAGRKVSIANDLLKIAQARNKALHQRVHHGDAAPFEQMENQRAVVQREGNVISAERALQKTAFELSIYFRDSSGRPIRVDRARLPSSFPQMEESFPSSDDFFHSDEQVQFLVSGHPEIKRYGVQLEQTQIDYQWAKNQMLPKFDLYLNASRDLGEAPVPTLSTAFFIPNYNYEVKAGMSFEIPLFLRTARGKVQAAQAQILKIEAQAELAQDKLRVQIQDALQALQVAKNRVHLAKQEIELAKKLEVGERTRFEHGDSNLLIVNLREQITVDAEIREVEAWVDFYRAQADYRASVTQFKSVDPSHG